jgi:hypothetical protein
MQRRILIDLPAADARALAGAQFDDAPALTVRYFDAAGTLIGEGEAPPAPTLLLEHSDGTGRMGWSSAALPIELSRDMPDGTASVALLAGDAVVATASDFALAFDSIPPPARSEKIHGTSGWRLRIIAERFAEPARFFAACRALVAHMKQVRPFDRPSARWRVSAHYWPSSGPGGLFQTFDPPPGDRRVFGRDQPLAKAFLDSLGPRDMGLVLVDSARRGGAGGVGAFWPSWSTIASEPGETWQDVTLHELGHAFGLADEYENSAETVAEPEPLEGNVARNAALLPARWAALVNAPPQRPTSSLATPVGGWGPGIVGTFQGARYRPDRFRPSPICRMRVAHEQFCPVCCDLIAARLR